MPIAAVPAYLGNDFKEASPGLRFGMLLPIWTERKDQEVEVKKRAEAKSREGEEIREILKRGMDHAIQKLCQRQQRQQRPLPGLWDKNDFAAREAWKNIKALTKADQERMKALADRQSLLAQSTPDLLRLEATATAPFTTGLGNEHPLENGFAFLNPYGLPYLPGSGVKGVMRQAARELASGEWSDAHGWSAGKSYVLPVGKENVALSMLDVLFGLESADGDITHVRGALSFWDVIPQIEGDSLAVEIITPHQSHYYQQKCERKAGDSASPHDSGQPTPISFLTIPPGSRFAFHVACDTARLARCAPELIKDERWQSLLTAAFDHAFAWLGFGAKTAVGYGAMENQPMREARKKRDEERRAREVAEAKRAEEARQEAEATPWPGARIKFNRTNKALSVEKDGKTANAIVPKSEQLLASLPEEIRKKVESNEFVKVTAYVSGSVLVRVEAP